MLFFCFFKQKTAYEMRISDWSSDVCSSDLLKAPKGKNLGRTARFDHLAVGFEVLDRHFHLQRAAGDAAGEDTADEIVAVQQRHQELERAVTVGDRLRHMIDDGFEHRRQIPRTGVRVEAGIAVAAGGIEHREIELVVAGVEADEQIEHFVKHFLDALVGRSEEHTSELQSLMRISYAVFCLTKKNKTR